METHARSHTQCRPGKTRRIASGGGFINSFIELIRLTCYRRLLSTNSRGPEMRKAGIHNFPAIDRVVYGKAASDALKDETERLNAKRVFLLASRTLNTKTDE